MSRKHYSSGALKLVPLPSGKSMVSCWWVFSIKEYPDEQVDCLKVRPVNLQYRLQ